MFDLRTDETIAAISTPPGVGGIGILRISGPRAKAMASRIFLPKAGRRSEYPERRAVFGALRDPQSGEILDEGFLIFFAAPRSYTRQDVIEINLHGSPAVLEEAVRLAVKSGARHAHPGEFTLRAYWNGRIDILQAEAVNDLIRAVSLPQARIASRQVRGGLTETILSLRGEFIELMADLEAIIEFPEEKTRLSDAAIQSRLEALARKLDRLIQSYNAGKALSEGLTLAIVGRTNVGKSTLFNALLGEARAIVTAKAGTTRDYIREKIQIDEASFQLIDMAGLGRAGSAVEKEGMRRGCGLAAEADGIVFLFDRSRPETNDDFRILEKFSGKKAILVFNKKDRPRKIRADRLRRAAPGAASIDVSALSGAGLPALRKRIHDVFVPKRQDGEELILHLRQKLLLEEAFEIVKAAVEAAAEKNSAEIISEEIRGALPVLGRLIGEIRSDDVMDNVFARFCVGK
jgi:tRNA modification GTPase